MKKMRIIIIVLGVTLFLEVIAIGVVWHNKRSELVEEYETKKKIIRLNQEKEKKALNNEYEKNRYLASGKNVYERTYNKKQSIIELIEGLANEAYPKNWRCEVKVEEFTNFILLIQINLSKERIKVSEIIKPLIPVISYSASYLKNVAVFDSRHKCFMFFDEDVLNKLKRDKALDDKSISDIKRKGRAFTRYDSIRIDYEEASGHIFIPAIIGGAQECAMMLDTGASITVISLELAGKTSYKGEDLNNVETRTFSTAMGLMKCPIVERNVAIGGIDKKQPVAVNVKDNANLLGVDFFNDYDYTIDSKAKCIYVWSK